MEKVKHYLKELIPYIIIILVVVLIRTFIVTPIAVNGTSMVPTLNDGERMILKKYDHNYERFDIIVINYEKDRLIKRVIGLPGETIYCKNNTIFINGRVLKDNYGKGNTIKFGPVKLNNNEYFVLGDNRVVSKDSRYFGAVPKGKILGTTNFVIFPFNKWGSVK